MATPPTILLCDHRATGHTRLAAALRARGFEVEESERLEDSLRALALRTPRVVVLDPLVEAGNSEIELARGRDPQSTPALLYLAAEELHEEALAALAERPAGSFDLVARRAGPAEIVWRVERLLAAGDARSEAEDLRHRALFDDRTELLRPKAFEQRLIEHFSAAERHHFAMALVLIDLDRFGQFNKLRDHTFGDLVIARVGAVIRRNLRTEDVAGRLGGDEFAVALPYTGPLEAAKVVRRLCDEIHALTSSLAPGSSELAVAASLGFETFDGTDLDSVASLRAHAERALREAKRLGGNRGVYFRSLPAEAAPG